MQHAPPRAPRRQAWRALEDCVAAQALPLLAPLADDGVVPRVLMSGAVVSRPGAGPQSFHADGVGRLANVFVPLVAIAPASDGTQFWRGSHREPSAGERVDADLTLASDGAAMAQMAAPGCAAGGMLAFDYRVIHRGLANDARQRGASRRRAVVVSSPRCSVVCLPRIAVPLSWKSGR